MTKNELNKSRKNREAHEKVFLEKLQEEGGDLQKMFTKGTVVATPKITKFFENSNLLDKDVENFI